MRYYFDKHSFLDLQEGAVYAEHVEKELEGDGLARVLFVGYGGGAYQIMTWASEGHNDILEEMVEENKENWLKNHSRKMWI